MQIAGIRVQRVVADAASANSKPREPSGAQAGVLFAGQVRGGHHGDLPQQGLVGGSTVHLRHSQRQKRLAAHLRAARDRRNWPKYVRLPATTRCVQ